MKGIHYLTDNKDRKIAVQIDLRKYGDLWEDFCDVLIAESRKDEESVEWEVVKDKLKKDRKL